MFRTQYKRLIRETGGFNYVSRYDGYTLTIVGKNKTEHFTRDLFILMTMDRWVDAAGDIKFKNELMPLPNRWGWKIQGI